MRSRTWRFRSAAHRCSPSTTDREPDPRRRGRARCVRLVEWWRAICYLSSVSLTCVVRLAAAVLTVALLSSCTGDDSEARAGVGGRHRRRRQLAGRCRAGLRVWRPGVVCRLRHGDRSVVPLPARAAAAAARLRDRAAAGPACDGEHRARDSGHPGVVSWRTGRGDDRRGGHRCGPPPEPGPVAAVFTCVPAGFRARRGSARLP